MSESNLSSTFLSSSKLHGGLRDSAIRVGATKGRERIEFLAKCDVLTAAAFATKESFVGYSQTILWGSVTVCIYALIKVFTLTAEFQGL